MIYKYSFSISGDNFSPEKILTKIHSDFIVDFYFNPTDKKFDNSPEEYGYGVMSFSHPKKYSTKDEIVAYERALIEFIETSHSLFTENGVNDFQIFMEIYFDGGQCNFEIFNKSLLQKLSSFKVSLPISVYILKEEEILEWENEIRADWANVAK